jgi:hypothetical protein
MIQQTIPKLGFNDSPAERTEIMLQENRVLGRVGARALTAAEVENVGAGIIYHTNTACFLGAKGVFTGDSAPYECGSNSDL